MQLFKVGKLRQFLADRLLEERVRKVIGQFEEQSLHPPGGDLVIQACYKATLDFLQTSLTFRKFMEDILRQRTDLGDIHFVNLYFRALQYIRFFVERESQIYLLNPRLLKKDWTKYLKKVMHDSKRRHELQSLLLTKDTSTTKYQRYVSLFALMNWFFPNSSVSLCDFGCGGNYGLKGIELEEKFDKVKDKTSKKFFTRLLEGESQLLQGLGIDKENPDDKKSRNWRLACSLYPSEISKLNAVLEFEQRLKGSRKVKFLKADLTKVEVLPLKSLRLNHQKAIPKSYFDIIMISTVLYQIYNPRSQIEILEKAKKCLKKHGILIVQDFVQKRDDGSLDFSISWFEKPFSSYKTLLTSADFNWRFLEIFKWENGRCLKVKDGDDLPILLKGYFTSSERAALAHSTS